MTSISVTIGAAVVLPVVLLTGCATDGGAASGDSSPPSATATAPDSPLKALLADAARTTQNLTTAHLVLRTTGAVDALGLIAGGDLDVQTNPLAARGTVTYDGQLDVPFSLADGNISVKLFDEWTPIGSVDELIPVGRLDPRKGIAAIADKVIDPRQEGTEEIDGVPVVKVTGTVPVDAARIMLPDTDNSHKVTAWIRNDGRHDMVRTLVDVGPGQSIETTLSKWNSAVDVAAPAPAR